LGEAKASETTAAAAASGSRVEVDEFICCLIFRTDGTRRAKGKTSGGSGEGLVASHERVIDDRCLFRGVCKKEQFYKTRFYGVSPKKTV
jgi:hypothetical protein